MIEIRPCAKCGRQMRMGAGHLTVNRKRGVYHYLDHRGIGPRCDAAADCGSIMLKPYPKIDSERPWYKMIERWNAEQIELEAKAGSLA